jgi:hypothetical protein
LTQLNNRLLFWFAAPQPKRRNAVPRFFFDVSVGDDFTRDDLGFEYESLAVAEYEATRAAAEISHDVLPKRRASDVCVRVRDGDVYLLFTVDVLMNLRRTARALV